MAFNDSMEKILERKKYDELMERSSDFFDSLKDRILGKIIEILGKIFLNIDFSGSSNKSVSLMLVFLLIFSITILIIIVGIILYFILKRSRRGKSMNEIFKDIEDKNITFKDILEKIKEFSEVGNYRESIRYYYVAILWLLDNKKIIRVDATKTNNQLKREINKNAPQFHKNFIIVVEIFNHVFFGHKELTKESFNSYIIKFKYLIKEVETFEK